MITLSKVCVVDFVEVVTTLDGKMSRSWWKGRLIRCLPQLMRTHSTKSLQIIYTDSCYGFLFLKEERFLSDKSWHNALCLTALVNCTLFSDCSSSSNAFLQLWCKACRSKISCSSRSSWKNSFSWSAESFSFSLNFWRLAFSREKNDLIWPAVKNLEAVK